MRPEQVIKLHQSNTTRNHKLQTKENQATQSTIYFNQQADNRKQLSYYYSQYVATFKFCTSEKVNDYTRHKLKGNLTVKDLVVKRDFHKNIITFLLQKKQVKAKPLFRQNQ